MKNKVLTAVFLLSWLAVFYIVGGIDQYMISIGQGVVYSLIAFTAMAVSGFLSGLLTLPEKPDKK